MLRKDRKSINNKYLKKQIILIAVIIIYVLSLSFISGRYVLKKIQTTLWSSKEFYFYSDKLYEYKDSLSEKDLEYTINWSGTGDCVIPVNLSTKLNNLEMAKYDLGYEVSYKSADGIICEVNKVQGTVLGSENGNNIDTFNLTVKQESVMSEENNWVEVTVITNTSDETQRSFEKILKARFVINISNNQEASYNIEDRDAYFNLVINNNSTNSMTITLEFNPEEVVVDTTNDIFSNINGENISINDKGYIYKIKFELEPLSNTTIKFFKNMGFDYTNSTTVVKVTGL